MPKLCKNFFIQIFLTSLLILSCLILTSSQAIQENNAVCTGNNDADDDDDDDECDDLDDDDGAGAPSCLAGTYLNCLSLICRPCKASCATCNHISKCRTCISGLIAQPLALGSLYVKCLCSDPTLFYSSVTRTCRACSLLFSNCLTCTVNACGPICKTCQTGFYLKATTGQCIACGPNCATCSSINPCLSCISIAKYSLGKCTPKPCSELITGCRTCTTSPLACTSCNTGLCISGTVCASCGGCPTNCFSCNSSGCQTCMIGFTFFATKTCQSCQTVLSDPGCSECTSTQCYACLTQSGYTLNTSTSRCEITSGCLSDQVFINSTCMACSSIYNTLCIQCNASDCILCSSGHFYNTTSKVCQTNPTSSVCGDGIWIDTLESCDDANLINFDGCNSQCQVEPDYACLFTDRLPSGASFCKFTKDLSIELNYIEKQVSSNTAHIFFAIEPLTFHQWTAAELQKLMAPITIVDQVSGISTVIPFSSIMFEFQGGDKNQLKLTIDYGQNSVENLYLKFSINPAVTSLASIKSLSLTMTNYAKLTSSSNGIDLFSYSDDTYQFQKTVSTMSTFLGYTAMVFAFLGLVCPVGKLIVVEALVVIQLTYFSILLFKKIPPTLIGFKNLSFSNGYNDPHLFESGIVQNDQTVFKLMGLNQSIFVNYNLSFILFFWVPFLIGSIGVLLFLVNEKLFSKDREISAGLIEGKDDDKNLSTKSNESPNFTQSLKFNVLKRVLLEFSFYGLLITGYLAWVSVLEGLRSGSSTNIVTAVLIFLVWISYGFTFMATRTDHIDIQKKKEVKGSEKLREQNRLFTIGFGQFRDVSQQIFKVQKPGESKFEKLYLILFFERVFIPVLIVYVGPLFELGSGIILGVYAMLVVALIVLQVKMQSNQNPQEKESRPKVCVHLYKNYLLRQFINLITVIFIQTLLMSEQIMLRDTENLKEHSQRKEVVMKVIPGLVLSLMVVNLAINVFLWAWEIKNSQLLDKAQFIKKSFIEDSKKQGIDQKDIDSSNNRKQRYAELQIEAEMDKMHQSGKLMTPKPSPFLGINEKQIRTKFLDVPRLENNVQMEESEKVNMQEWDEI